MTTMGRHHIHLLIPGQYQNSSELRSSNLASIRLRSALVDQQMRATGWEVTFGEVIPGKPDVVLVGKIGAQNISERGAYWISQLISARSVGSKIFLDFTDNHLRSDSPMQEFYRRALPIADHCIAPGSYLKNLLSSHVGCPVSLVADPLEISTFQVTDRPHNEPLSLFWFGHGSNLPYLVKFLEQQLIESDFFRLVVLCDSNSLTALKQYRLKTKAKLSVALGVWSIDSMINASRGADLCIIPSDPTDPRKAGASSNRLITSLALGLPTATDMLPSYQEFADYVVDLKSNDFRETLLNPKKLHVKTAEAQHQIIPRFTPEVIGKQWLELLSQTA